MPVAYAEHKGFVPVRKKGKLPCETVSVKYALEYGTAEIEMHKDSIIPGQKVVIIDDLIATGGTTEAIIKLIEGLGGKVVKICFVMELAGLKGRELLKGYDVDLSLIHIWYGYTCIILGNSDFLCDCLRLDRFVGKFPLCLGTGHGT